MSGGSSQTKRVLAIVVCGAIAFMALKWMGARQEEGTFFQPQPVGPQPTLLRRAETVSEELPVQAEAKLADCRLPTYELRIAPGDLRSIEIGGYGNGTYPATFLADGKVYEGVKVRARGSWSRSWPKKSFKIQFDHKNPFGDHHSLNLNSAWRDPAFVREVLAYQVFAACGVPASRAQMVRLQVNGRFHGLYVEVEQPDKPLLARHHLKGADLYKAASRSRDADERLMGDEASYHQAYTKETKKTENFNDLVTFCQALSQSGDTVAFFNQYVDVEEYINYLAAGVLVQNWDGFNKNHYLAFDTANSGKWRVIPWDLDRTLGDHWHMRFDETRLPVLLGTRASPGVTGWNRLEERFFSEPALRAKFLDRLSELLEKQFTREKLFPVLDQLEADIASAAELDRQRWPSPGGDFHAGIAGVKAFIEERRAYLLEEIPRLRGQRRL